MIGWLICPNESSCDGQLLRPMVPTGWEYMEDNESVLIIGVNYSVGLSACSSGNTRPVGWNRAIIRSWEPIGQSIDRPIKGYRVLWRITVLSNCLWSRPDNMQLTLHATLGRLFQLEFEKVHTCHLEEFRRLP